MNTAIDSTDFRDPFRPVAVRVEALLKQLTLAEKAGLLVMENVAVERLGIGAYHWWSEALHGFARAGEATVFPQAIGLAASWSPALLHAVADVAATEGRAKFNDELATHGGNSRRYYGVTIWSPNINIFRDPRWGRGQETYGEDPFLTACLGTAFVRGIQGDDPRHLKAVATLKHFAVHSGPEALRHLFDASVSEKDLRDTYLPAFEEGVRVAGAKSVMSAYNGFNGSPCVVSRRLLTEILRGEWGFDGAVVGDVDNIEDLYLAHGHRWAQTGAECVAGAIKAGNDLRSGGYPEHAQQALEQGLLSEVDVDRALRRLLTLRFQLGHFDPPESIPWDGLSTSVIRSQKHVELACRAARESLVLLKNDGLLPLKPEGLRKVAVIGPTADDMDVLVGNYAGTPVEPVTLLQGLKRKLEPLGVEILQEQGIPYADGSRTRGMPIPNGVFFADADGIRPGLLCRMYNGTRSAGAPVVEQVEMRPFLEWNGVCPRPSQLTGVDSTVVWSGFMKLECSGDHTFHVRLHGGFALEIAGQTVVAEERPEAIATLATFTVPLRNDRLVPVTVTWRQRHTEGYLVMNWNAPADGKASRLALERAMALAAQADLVILTLGLSYKLEGEEMSYSYEGFHHGDRTTIAMPAPQQELLDRITALKKKTILLLSSGSGIAFNPDPVNAVLQTWYYGQQGGRAVADALFGEFSPAGRLPVTFYRRDADLPAFEDYTMKGRTYRYFEGKPLFAFGHGLTYTAFAYSGLDVRQEGDGLVATLTVTNTGKVASDEVVQLYASREDRAAGDPFRWLVGFQRIYDLAPGETRVVGIAVPKRWLALWNDQQKKRVVAPGELCLAAGPASDNLLLKGTVVIEKKG